MSPSAADLDPLDLAVIGAGAAGTFVADAVQQARPDWTIALFERSSRVGGRLRSVAIPGIDHRIELGGMRYLTSHRRVASIVDGFGLRTHPFDATGGSERTFLRGRFGAGSDDPASGAGYALADDEVGRSAANLIQDAFRRVIPGAGTLSPAAYTDVRATGSYLGRPVRDWAIAEAIGSVRSAEGHRFVTDAFGYDSGSRAFNAGDAIEFLLGGGDPTAEARTPDEGMDQIPGALARRFEAGGGSIRLGHQLRSIEVDGGRLRLGFDGERSILADRVVVAVPIPALRRLALASVALRSPAFGRVLDSVEGFPAMKLYLWYERPWWRPSVRGIRTTTDLSVRKVFYLDSRPDGPAALLAMYTDGRHVDPWRDLLTASGEGSPPMPAMPAPEPILAEVRRQLRELHPEVADIPAPAGSALQHWGADPDEIGWTFWRAGYQSDEIMASAIQPDPAIAVYLAGESFSRSQSWVEGALETAGLVVARVLDASR